MEEFHLCLHFMIIYIQVVSLEPRWLIWTCGHQCSIASPCNYSPKDPQLALPRGCRACRCGSRKHNAGPRVFPKALHVLDYPTEIPIDPKDTFVASSSSIQKGGAIAALNAQTNQTYTRLEPINKPQFQYISSTASMTAPAIVKASCLIPSQLE